MDTPHTLSVPLDASLYLELALHLRDQGDGRLPAAAIEEAVRLWLHAERSSARARHAAAGYQWKDVFLPEHTLLRVHTRSGPVCAEVVGSQLLYEGRPTTPARFAQLSRVNVRNAWRQLSLRWPGDTQWLPALRARTSVHHRQRGTAAAARASEPSTP